MRPRRSIHELKEELERRGIPSLRGTYGFPYRVGDVVSPRKVYLAIEEMRRGNPYSHLPSCIEGSGGEGKDGDRPTLLIGIYEYGVGSGGPPPGHIGSLDTYEAYEERIRERNELHHLCVDVEIEDGECFWFEETEIAEYPEHWTITIFLLADVGRKGGREL